MSLTAEIKEKTLGLSREERAELADLLLDSLDEGEEISSQELERLHLAEVQRRDQEVLDGKSQYLDGDAVISRLMKKYSEKV